MKIKFLALLCAVWVAALPHLCFAQAANTSGNDGDPTKTGGVRVLGRDGTYDRGILTNSSGQLDVLSGYPQMDVLQHRTNVSVNAAANDSSAIPVDTRGYRQLYVLIRSKAASFGAAPISLQLAVRSVSQAAYDSTAAGWWYGLGKGSKYGKTLPMLDLNDRWKMVPLTDSLTFTPFVAPYTGIYLTNLTGAQWIGDTWLLGVR